MDELVFDIEAAGADELHSYGDGFVRLSGYAWGEGEPVNTTDHSELVDQIRRADKIIGHFILGFDIPALSKYHGLDYREAAKKAVDTLIVERQVDPPLAQGMPNGYYTLDSVAKRLGIPGKTHDLKALAKKHGGFDQIPVDDEEYNTYLKGDVTTERAVYNARKNVIDNDPYIAREHEVMARFGYAGMQGFRVDTELLQRRLDEQAVRKEENFKKLEAVYGVPLKDAKGKPHKSPLATKDGKAALVKALADCGAIFYPKTEKAGSLDISRDGTAKILEVYGDPDLLRRMNIDPSTVDFPRIQDLIHTVKSVTGERTVYQTIDTYRIGDRIFPQVSPSQASGRWSVTKPGLTVLGKREGRYVEREVLLPEEGDVLIAFDLDQVDARAIAGHCQDPKYMAFFEPGRDLHTEVAEMVFGRSDGEWRDRAKILGHGFNYGLGPKSASKQTGVPYDIAEQFDKSMKEQFPVMAEWQAEVRALAEDGQLLDNGFGRMMRPNPDRAYTQAPALKGQGATRDILAEGILRLPWDIIKMLRVVIHDEAVFSVPENQVDEVTEAVLNAFQFEWKGIQITAGASKAGKSWGAVYKK